MRSRYRLLLWTMGLTLGVLLTRSAVLLTSPNYNVASEANSLYGVLELVDGKPLYPSMEQKPYGVYLYSPLHAYLAANVIKQFNIKTLSAQIIVTRLISLGSLLASILLLGLIVVKESKVSFLSFGLALLLALPKFSDYATSGRNDMLSLLFEMASFVSFFFFLKKRSSLSLWTFFLFSCLSVWTRQTGVMVFGSALLWLFHHREFRLFIKLSVFFIVANCLIFSWLYQTTGSHVVDHLILSNIRGFRPLNFAFFDFSLLTFFASYILFGIWGFLGFKESFVRRSETSSYFATVVVVSLAFSSSFFMRAGGDVNYFFLTMFLGVYFVSLFLDKTLLSDNRTASLRFLSYKRGALVVSIQCALVCFIYISKCRSALTLGSLPFASTAAQIESGLPGPGYIIGKYGPILNVYLRQWAVFGPDVTNGGLVARNAHVKFRRLLFEADEAIRSGVIKSLVIASPDCLSLNKLIGAWEKYFNPVESLNNWTCVFRSKVRSVQIATLKPSVSNSNFGLINPINSVTH